MPLYSWLLALLPGWETQKCLGPLQGHEVSYHHYYLISHHDMWFRLPDGNVKILEGTAVPNSKIPMWEDTQILWISQVRPTELEKYSLRWGSVSWENLGWCKRSDIKVWERRFFTFLFYLCIVPRYSSVPWSPKGILKNKKLYFPEILTMYNIIFMYLFFLLPTFLFPSFLFLSVDPYSQ